MAFNINEIERLTEQLKRQAELQERISSSFDGYLDGLKEAKKVNDTITRNRRYDSEIQQKIRQAAAIGDTQEEARQKKILSILRRQTGEFEEHLRLLRVTLDEANKGNILMTKTGAVAVKMLSSIPKLMERGYGKIKGLGLFDMDKAIRKSALNMGVLNNEYGQFYDTIKDSTYYSAQLGVSMEELAKFQSDYTDELGRNVRLSQQTLKSVTDIAASTQMGVEAAAKMTAEFDTQGLSIKNTQEYIDQALSDTHKLGLNAAKVVKNIQGGIKLLNRYNFKDGIKGLAKMAELSAKIGTDMMFATSMSDKLWDIEGAVEMSAQLQVLGGDWAKMADPFRLMYMARNDMEALTSEIANAASASARFASDGSIQMSAYEMDRLKKIAQQTGLEYDKLVEAGKTAFKLKKIKAQVSFSASDEEKEFISNIATFGSDGKATVMVKGETKFVKQLNESDRAVIRAQMTEKRNMEERARASQNFDEALGNTMNMAKVALLPIVKEMNDRLLPKILKLQKRFETEKWGEKIEMFADKVGVWASKLMGVLIDNPMTTAMTYLGAKTAEFIFDKSQWFLNGIILAKGFNTGASASGMFGAGGSVMAGITSSKFMKYGAMAAAAISAYSEFQENLSNQNISTGENIGRTVTTGALTGLGMFGGAKLGAQLGSRFGVYGAAAGSIIGGGIGAWGGGKASTITSDAIFGEKVHDGVSTPVIEALSDRAGTKRSIISGGKIHPIDDADSFITKKPNGAIDKAIGGVGGTVNHKFEDLRVNGELKLNLIGSNGNQIGTYDLLRNQDFIRELVGKITSEIQVSHNQKLKG